MRWVKLILSHVSFICKSNTENRIKIRWFLTTLQIKISWLLFYGPQCSLVCEIFNSLLPNRTMTPEYFTNGELKPLPPQCTIILLEYRTNFFTEFWTFSLHLLIVLYVFYLFFLWLQFADHMSESFFLIWFQRQTFKRIDWPWMAWLSPPLLAEFAYSLSLFFVCFMAE